MTSEELKKEELINKAKELTQQTYIPKKRGRKPSYSPTMAKASKEKNLAYADEINVAKEMGFITAEAFAKFFGKKPLFIKRRFVWKENKTYDKGHGIRTSRIGNLLLFNLEDIKAYIERHAIPEEVTI